jgi:nicotinic acid phosphoribosyltransferase
MKFYSTHAIDQLTRHCLKDPSGFNWLMNNGYRELIAVLDAVRDDKKAFEYLMENKHYELAAFVNAIWEDQKAFKFLLDAKAFDWAAAANIINGDDNAENALKRAGKNHFVLMAHAIQSRIHEDSDRNMSPWGVFQNLLNFKKAMKK